MRRLALALFLVFPVAATAGPCAGFLDVDDSSSFCADVSWVRNRGITLGCTANLYCPSADVTRLQMAAFLHRLGNVTFQQGGNAFGAAGVIGTTDNQALDVHAGNARAMRYEPNAISPNVIGGHSSNGASAGVRGGTIGGGGIAGGSSDPTYGLGSPNVVTDHYGTVAGGLSNVAGDAAGTVSDRAFATVGGGRLNTASGDWATVGGGVGNIADGAGSSVGGGSNNLATGSRSTVPGGNSNFAGGDYSFASGSRAKATHHRSFVWGGSTTGDTASQADGDFVVYAPGAVRLFAGAPGAGGCTLTSGASGWACSSDRSLKSAIATVDGREVLDRVAALPIARWSFANVPGVMHMGPMAQDFHALFGLGDDATRLAPMDVQGVALAAIQGLKAQLERALLDRDATIAELKARVERLEARRRR